jgi:hypothetical protein
LPSWVSRYSRRAAPTRRYPSRVFFAEWQQRSSHIEFRMNNIGFWLILLFLGFCICWTPHFSNHLKITDQHIVAARRNNISPSIHKLFPLLLFDKFSHSLAVHSDLHRIVEAKSPDHDHIKQMFDVPDQPRSDWVRKDHRPHLTAPLKKPAGAIPNFMTFFWVASFPISGNFPWSVVPREKRADLQSGFLLREWIFIHEIGLNKSPKACESGRFSAEYDNLGFNPDTKSCTKILGGFVWRIARNGDFMYLSYGWSVLIQ